MKSNRSIIGLASAIVVLWLLVLAVTWSRLPVSIPVHFDLGGHPNWSLGPLGFLGLTCGLLLFDVILVAVITPKIPPGGVLAVGGLVVAAMAAEVVLFASLAGLFASVPVGTALMALIAVVIVASVFLILVNTTKRGVNDVDASGPPTYEASHRSARLFWINVPIGAAGVGGAVVAAIEIPEPLVRALIGLAAVIGIGVLGYVLRMMWFGFHYQLYADSVVIRGAWGTLESIPRSAIRRAVVEQCQPLRDFGGWGVRSGRGGGKAYILDGQTVVHLSTTRGEFFLGSRNAEELAQRLAASVG